MASPTPSPGERLRFGPFELELRSGELRKQGRLLRLQQQPARVLALLASRPQALVTRAEIQAAVWGDDTFVDFEQGLNFCVRQIRAALGDDAEAPRYVETLPRRGYRFVAPVEVLSPPSAAGVGEPSPGAEAPRPAPPGMALPLPPADRRAPWLPALLGLALTAIAALLLFTLSRRPAPPPPGKVMLVVLPFENLSDDPTQDYFGDGLTEEMITRLAQWDPERLGVIARTSAMVYKGARLPVDRIGAELGVDFVLEGSVRRGSSRLKIVAQLIRVADQTHVWAEAYDRSAADVLDVQEEVAGRIAAELLPRLASASPPAAVPVASPAYDAYLRARVEMARPSGQGLLAAQARLAEAVAVDPGFAPAHAALASVLIGLVDTRALSEGVGFARVRAAAEQALRLDPRDAEALAALGVVRMYHDWDWEGAREAFARALAEAPSRAATHHLLAGFHSARGEHAAALAAIEQARRLDPLSSAVTGDLGWYYAMAGRDDEAIRHYRRALELAPSEAWVRDFLVEALVRSGRLIEAKEEALLTLEARADPLARSSAMRDGAPADVVRAFLERRLDAPSSSSPLSPPFLFTTCAALGRRDEALRWLEQAVTTRSRWLVAVARSDPAAAALRAEPRYLEVLRRLGLS